MKSLTSLTTLQETSVLPIRFTSQSSRTPRLSLKPITAYSRGKIEFFLRPEKPSGIPRNELHRKKLAPRLAELQDLKKIRGGSLGPLSREFQLELTERIIRKADLILRMSNIHLNIIENSPENYKQLVTICPLTQRLELSTILLELVPEICSIPYSLLGKIGFRTLSFCDEVVVGRTGENLNEFTKKASMGIIQVAKCDSPAKAISMVYRMIVKSLLAYMPELKGYWIDFIRKIQMTRAREVDFFGDLSMTMMALIKNKRTGVQSDNVVLNLKVSELKNKLRVFDAEGFDEIKNFDEKRRQSGHTVTVKSLPAL